MSVELVFNASPIASLGKSTLLRANLTRLKPYRASATLIADAADC